MKQIVLILILLFNSLTFSAKDYQLYNASLIDTAKDELYIGCVNKIMFTGADTNLTYCIITNDLDTQCMVNNTLNYMPKSSTQESITVIDNQNNIILKKVFTCKNVPEPNIVIGNEIKEYYSINDLIEHRQIRAILPGNNLRNINFILHSYKMFVYEGDKSYPLYKYRPKGSVDTVLMVDPISLEEILCIKIRDQDFKDETYYNIPLDDDTITKLKALPENAIVCIYNVRASFSNGAIRYLNEIFLKW